MNLGSPANCNSPGCFCSSPAITGAWYKLTHLQPVRLSIPLIGIRQISTLGLDIGGANIKAADSDGHCVTVPFAIWKRPEFLTAQLRDIATGFPRLGQVTVTMTAELADCFTTKSIGVQHILQAVTEALPGCPVRVWLTAGCFANVPTAIAQPMLAAASNWQALATFSTRYVSGQSAILIDIGTTTTDLIPLSRTGELATGRTDVERLVSGELIYTGSRRTPLCAICDRVPFRGGWCPLAAEWFATSLDLGLLLHHLPEEPENRETANNRPATVAESHARIARQLCGDTTEVSLDEAQQIATFLYERQLEQIQVSVQRVLERIGACDSVIVSGSGGFMARHVIDRHAALQRLPLVSLESTLGSDLAEAACAYAVAMLGEEDLQKNS